MFPFRTHPHGKLLLTGEYFVLEGALALACPVRYGQTLQATPDGSPGKLTWRSLDETGTCWFEGHFRLPDLETLSASDAKTAEVLRGMLLSCRRQQPGFLADGGWSVETRTDFPRAWGLGTSSTLVAALGRWAGADPYRVLSETLGGSGYDLACAYAEGPILYRLGADGPTVRAVDFRPTFADDLYFVYLGQKQDSREGIRHFRNQRPERRAAVAQRISDLTEAVLAAPSLEQFAAVLREHEGVVADSLGLTTAQTQWFPDCPGTIKSLGAWGGDFVLATAWGNEAEIRAYFSKKGFQTAIPYREMALF